MRLAVLHIRHGNLIRGQDSEILAVTVFQVRQRRTAARGFMQTVIRQRRIGRNALAVLRAVDEILSIICYVRIVVDLINALVQFFLNLRAVGVRIRVVRRVDDLFFQGLQDIHGTLYGAFGDLHHTVAVLRVLIVLIERTNLHAHTLRDGVARRVVLRAVDAHARRDRLEALRQRGVVPVQRVQRVDRRQVVPYYHRHPDPLPCCARSSMRRRFLRHLSCLV